MVDAKSVYESLNATNFKPPAENSLAGHVLWIREMTDKKLIGETRDMLADGLTKGAISRDGLQNAMDGKFRFTQPIATSERKCLRIRT